MNLNKQHWSDADFAEFQNYVKTFEKTEEDKIRSQKIANTNYPTLAVPVPILNSIAKEIFKGNYAEFFGVTKFEYRENIVVCAKIISLIKDFEQKKKFIYWLIPHIDSWEGTDSIRFNNFHHEEEKYFELAKELIENQLTFARRLGSCIFERLIKNEAYAEQILDLLSAHSGETEYYVNMAYSWVICNAVIYHRDLAINFLKTKPLNDFVKRKAISKCHDSFRVSDEDKALLKKLLV